MLHGVSREVRKYQETSHEEYCVLGTECIYVFRMMPTIKKENFPK